MMQSVDNLLAGELESHRVIAAQALRDGKLIGIPTETVYGLGANALNDAAVARVFAVKNRPRFDPLICHAAEISVLELLVEPGVETRRAFSFAMSFWPGPLTLVLPRSRAASDLVTAELSTVAVRIPRHAITLDILSRAAVPVAAPSANPFGRVSPTRAEHVVKSLGNALDFVVDGGVCEVGLESTILFWNEGSPVVLRHGGVSTEELERRLGRSVGVRTIEAGKPVAPGQLMHHYGTEKTLRLFEHWDALRRFMPSSACSKGPCAVSLICVEGAIPQDVGERFCWQRELAPDGDLLRAAPELFQAMRDADASSSIEIWVVGCRRQGIGLAIMDRLDRAAYRE